MASFIFISIFRKIHLIFSTKEYIFNGQTGAIIMKKILLFISALFLSGCAAKNGAVCFTFDDFDRQGWLNADNIFKKYHAHATFFFSGEIDQDRLDVMKKLRAAGHTIGLHTVRHKNAAPLEEQDTIEQYFDREVLPQLEKCRKNNIEIKSFAYPNNRHTPKTDAFMYKYFDFLRAGYGKNGKPVYIPLADISEKMVLPGGGIGKYYDSKLDDLIAILDHAAENNSLTVFFSHRIMPEAVHVHISPELLEALLAHARKRNMHIIGAEELHTLRGK